MRSNKGLPTRPYLSLACSPARLLIKDQWKEIHIQTHHPLVGKRYQSTGQTQSCLKSGQVKVSKTFLLKHIYHRS